MRIRGLFYFVLLTLIACSEDDSPVVNPTPPGPTESSANNVTEMTLSLNETDYSTSISGTTITINDLLPYGTEELSVKSISISDKATSSINTGDVINIGGGSYSFSVTAENGASKNYTISASFEERTFDVTEYEPVAVSKSNSTKVFAHYMPWFQSKDVSRFWNIHWTQANRNPDIVQNVQINIPELGEINVEKREIAAHFYPLIGPYDSGDEDLHEYHTLLMKLSGIDGVIFDYPGAILIGDRDVRIDDVEAMVPVLKSTGLEFAIMYEDRDIELVVNNNQIDESEIVSTVQADLRYLGDNYFSQPHYAYDGMNPLLLIFGPIYIQSPDLWTDIFSQSNPKPDFYTLWGESRSDAGNNAVGEFGWIWAGDNIGSHTRLEQFYQNDVPRISKSIPSAYPGFKDYYYEGGWSDDPEGIGWEVDHNGTSTLETCLDLAHQNDANMIQIATWNDIQEGTMIEPTLEFGFDMLKEIQEFSGVNLNSDDLVLPYKLYKYRKEFEGDSYVNQVLDQIYFYLVSLQLDEARELLDNL